MRARCLFLLFSFGALLACGDPETDDASATGVATGGMGDGRYHPEPNGVQISEDEACAIMQGAFQDRLTTLQASTGCTKTSRLCVNFLRLIPGHDPDCVAYDEGSAQGCAAYYKTLSCSELAEDVCVATVYPGTSGCP